MAGNLSPLFHSILVPLSGALLSPRRKAEPQIVMPVKTERPLFQWRAGGGWW